MKTFREHFIIERQAQTKQLDNWDELQEKSDMLRVGVELCKEIESMEQGAEALIVGGSVRDILLGKDPKDVDIATNVDTDAIADKFKAHDIGQSRDFGIVNVVYKGFDFEVAHYRAEFGSTDARRPDEVEMINDFEADSARRDFTINSMGITSDGKIIDYQGGLEDLKNKIIRTVGKAAERYKDDALRIYRLFRFAVKYGFEIDKETLDDAVELKDITDNLSKERIADEIYKVASLGGKPLADYIRRLDSAGLLEKELPELASLKGLIHDPRHHPEGGPFEHSLAALEASRVNDPVTNLAILFHDLGKGLTYKNRDGKHTYYGHEGAAKRPLESIANRLKLSTADKKAIQFGAYRHMVMHYPERLSKSKLASIVNDPNWPVLKEVVWGDEMSRGPTFKKDGVDTDFDNAAEFNRKMDWAEDVVKNMSKGAGHAGLKLRLSDLIDGNRLISWVPELNERNNRPMIGKIMNDVKEFIINNDRFDIKEEEVKDMVIKLASKYLSNNFNEFTKNDLSNL